MKPVFIHAPGYDIALPLIDRFHPFDGRKFSRAWNRVRERAGAGVDAFSEMPDQPASDESLSLVHTAAYLDAVGTPSVVAKALEVSLLGLLPRAMVRERILKPMRLAVAGTVLATRRALEPGGAVAMNFGGGFHHAFADHGEGFCLFADVAVALASARAAQALVPTDPIAIIDLDAHRGNGVWSLCGADPAVRVFDVYNFQAYPGLFPGDVADFPFQIPVKAGTGDERYLAIVRDELPPFLDLQPRPRLAVYNAGTDIVAGDPVGHLGVSPEGVRARDRMVVRALVERGIPTVIVTSGGYTDQSHALIADLALEVMRCLAAA